MGKPGIPDLLLFGETGRPALAGLTSPSMADPGHCTLINALMHLAAASLQEHSARSRIFLQSVENGISGQHAGALETIRLKAYPTGRFFTPPAIFQLNRFFRTVHV
ncbi:MAG: hypothetical protein HZA50_16035 [Planctomycetes bacterium]|nr:hypothetical protein [Planctomycetota bacterium]